MTKKIMTTVVLAATIIGSACFAEKPKEIRIWWAGTSSTTSSLILNTKALINSTGKFKVTSGGKDKSGYSSLTALFEPEEEKKWLEKNIQTIKNGNYDYVVLQMLYRYLYLTPADQENLFENVLPRVVNKIREAGAEVVLFDKYVQLPNRNDTSLPQKVRDWSPRSRYPDSERLFYLLSFTFGKYANVNKMSFGGLANNDLWKKEQFINMRSLFNEGHPGPMGDYISACGVATAITGVNMIGNPIRNIYINDHQIGMFEKEKKDKVFYDKHKDKIKDGFFTLTDEEADVLQKTAMKYHLDYTDKLKQNINNEEVFKQTLTDIKAIQGEMDKFDEYGLSTLTIGSIYGNIKGKYPFYGCPNSLKQELLKKALKKITSPSQKLSKTVGIALRKHSDKKEVVKEIFSKWATHWEGNNNKFREDLLRAFITYNITCSEENEVGRLSEIKKLIDTIYSLPCFMISLDYMSEKEKRNFVKHSVKPYFKKELSPEFYSYVKQSLGNQEELIKGWKCYLKVITDPQLMDDIKDAKFSNESWLAVDKVFNEKMQ